MEPDRCCVQQEGEDEVVDDVDSLVRDVAHELGEADDADADAVFLETRADFLFELTRDGDQVGRLAIRHHGRDRGMDHRRAGIEREQAPLVPALVGVVPDLLDIGVVQLVDDDGPGNELAPFDGALGRLVDERVGCPERGHGFW